MTKALPFDEDAELPVDVSNGVKSLQRPLKITQKRIKARFTQEPDLDLLARLGISPTGKVVRNRNQAEHVQLSILFSNYLPKTLPSG